MADKLTLDIFIHMDAVGRNEWTGPGDERPLTELGRSQSDRIASQLTAAPLHALYSSPAKRCTESLEALSEKSGLPVTVLPGFRDTLGYKAPPGWENPDRPGGDPLGGAWSAGSAFSAFEQIRREVPEGGRAVLCSYGDIVPALLAFLAGSSGVEMPAKNNKKGAVYSIRFADGQSTLSLSEPSADFPQ
jgi:broad specificity phosphatase PhoE